MKSQLDQDRHSKSMGVEYDIVKNNINGHVAINLINSQRYTLYGIRYDYQYNNCEEAIQGVIDGICNTTKLFNFSDILHAIIIFAILDDSIILYKNRYGVEQTIDSFGTMGSTILRLILEN